jgi:hydroxymethylpyrimidine pyrophosphatase-like HAD family hydrolase
MAPVDLVVTDLDGTLWFGDEHTHPATVTAWRELERRVAHALAGTAETHLAPSSNYGAYTFTVTPIGLSKWNGVVAFCNRAGLDTARVLAIGDGPNDVELLGAAAISVAPVDGDEAVVGGVDHVVGSPRDPGWAEILDLA